MDPRNAEMSSRALDTDSAPRLLLVNFSHAEKCKHILHPGSPTQVLRYCPPCVIKEDLENFKCIKEVLDEHIENQKTKDNEFNRIRTKLRQRRVTLANDVIRFEKWVSYETKWDKRNPDVDTSNCYSSSAALKLARYAADAAAAAEPGIPETESVKEGAEKKKPNKKQKVVFHPFQQHRPESQYRPQAYWARKNREYKPGLYSNPTGDGWQNTSFMNDLGYHNRERRLSRGEKNASRRKKIGDLFGFGVSDLDSTNQRRGHEEELIDTSDSDDDIEQDSESDAGSDSEDIETIIRRESDQDNILDDMVFEASDDGSYDLAECRPDPLCPFHLHTNFPKWEKASVKETDEKENHQGIVQQENHLPSLNGSLLAFPQSSNCIIETVTVAIPLAIHRARTAREPLQGLEPSILAMLVKLRKPPRSAFFLSGHMKRKWLHKVSRDQFDSEGRMKRDCILLAYQNKLDELGITREYWNWLSVKNIDDCTVPRPRQEWFL